MRRWVVTITFFGLATVLAGAERASKEPAKETPRASLDPGLPSYRASNAVSGNIRTAGNIEDMETLIKLWIGAFTKVQPAVRFTLSSPKDGSGRSVPALLEGKADISLIGREMRPSEIADFTRRYGHQPFSVRVAGGSYRGHSFAPCFFVNKANPIDKLSLDQLDAIYSKTRKRGYRADITTWGQLGLKGEWANRPITVYGLNPVAGTTVFLRERLLRGGEWKDGIKEVKYERAEADWHEMVSDVANDPTGIGFASFAHVNPGVKPLALAEREGGPYFKGSFEEVASHRYPLSRFVFIVLNRAPSKSIDPKVKEFLRFILSKEGQEAVQKEGEYLPIPADIVKQERAKLE